MTLDHPLPTSSDLQVEVVKCAPVVNDEIRPFQAFLAGNLTLYPSPGVGCIEASEGDQSLNRKLGRDIDDDDSGEFDRFSFDEQRDIEHDYLVGFGELLALMAHVFSYRRMNDFVEHLEFVSVAEDDFCQFGPVEFAVVADDAITKMGDDCVEDRHTRGLQSLHRGVGIDQSSPKSNKTLTSRRFAGSDPSGQPKFAHYLKLHERTDINLFLGISAWGPKETGQTDDL